jgi:hypothetical protein
VIGCFHNYNIVACSFIVIAVRIIRGIAALMILGCLILYQVSTERGKEVCRGKHF